MTDPKECLPFADAECSDLDESDDSSSPLPPTIPMLNISCIDARTTSQQAPTINIEEPVPL